MANRWVCAQCGGPGDPDKVTAIDPRYTTGRCATGKHKGTQRLVREDTLYTRKAKRKKAAIQMPLPEPVPDGVTDPLPGWADKEDS